MNYPRGEYQKINKIATGGYGKVYLVRSPSGMEKAIKCNMKSKTENFLSSARELNVNHTLGRHPYIISISKITHVNPFNNSVMSPPEDMNHDMDRIQLVYDYAEGGHLRDYILKNKDVLNLSDIKRMMVEILLAVEYIHGSGFIHRDIREDNILIMKDKDGIFRVNVSDFGHAKPFAQGMKQTPGVVSCWWRPPEICLGSETYNQLADMWSVGCVFYYMISGKRLTNINTEKGDVHVNSIIKNLPYSVTNMEINSINFIKAKIENDTLIPQSMDNFLGMGEEGKEYSNSIGGYSNLCSVITGLLSFLPSKRLSATQTLNHPFFDDMRPHIDEIRSKYPPVPVTYPPAQVFNSAERTWGMCMAFGVYNGRMDLFKSWYSDRILFHSISFFDLYLSHISGAANTSIIPTPYMGTCMTRKDAELLYLTCLYFSIKYFSSIQSPISFSILAKPEYCGEADMLKVERFENILVANVLSYMIYRDTPYDYMCKQFNPNSNDIYSMLVMITNGHHNNQTPMNAYNNVWLPRRDYYMNIK